MLDSLVFLEGSCGGGGGGSASDGVAVELPNEAGSGEADRNSSANRWPREETLALLKIRSDMDSTFRDSTLKAPLWDEVSRKLSEFGYHRSGKKCKEKFENIYKYHKRTKDVRSGQNGKSYRFFEQLELLDAQFMLPSNQIPVSAPATAVTATPIICSPENQGGGGNAEFASASSSSSGRDSDGSVKKKKRKLVDYLEGLMRDVLEKQELLQNKFLEAIEKCEKDRMAREEAWKAEEMARIKREQEYLAQERAVAAEKDAAVLAFLHKFTHQTPDVVVKRPDNQESSVEKHDDTTSAGGENAAHTSSSRWPKTEVEALIALKSDLDLKYLDNGPKGPLWEEISSQMKKLGYNRSGKRCKEKWENINKYYKRVKESNRRRPEDSKTCPYFNLLESLYAKKAKRSDRSSVHGTSSLPPEQILMQMVSQQQQEPRHDSNDRLQGDGPEDEHRFDSRNGANNLSSVTTLG